jgi:hypothetical protein
VSLVLMSLIQARGRDAPPTSAALLRFGRSRWFDFISQPAGILDGVDDSAIGAGNFVANAARPALRSAPVARSARPF